MRQACLRVCAHEFAIVRTDLRYVDQVHADICTSSLSHAVVIMFYIYVKQLCSATLIYWLNCRVSFKFEWSKPGIRVSPRSTCNRPQLDTVNRPKWDTAALTGEREYTFFSLLLSPQNY